MVDIKTFENSMFRLDDFFKLTKYIVIQSDFFHVKNNWLINLLILLTFIHVLRLFNISDLIFWCILDLPFIHKLFREMQSLNRNEKKCMF